MVSEIHRFLDRYLVGRQEADPLLHADPSIDQTGSAIWSGTNIGQPIFWRSAKASAWSSMPTHFNANNVDDQYILWNNYYEYHLLMRTRWTFYCRDGPPKRNLSWAILPNTPTISQLSIPFQLESCELATERKSHPIFYDYSLVFYDRKAYWLVGARFVPGICCESVFLIIYGKGGEEGNCVLWELGQQTISVSKGMPI